MDSICASISASCRAMRSRICSKVCGGGSGAGIARQCVPWGTMASELLFSFVVITIAWLDFITQPNAP